MKGAVRHLLERVGAWLPAAVALALPITFIPLISDSYILPRASIVIAGACLGVGLSLLGPGSLGLGTLRWPLLTAALAALLAFAFSISWPLSLAGSYTRYESLPMRLSYLGLLVSAVWALAAAHGAPARVGRRRVRLRHVDRVPEGVGAVVRPRAVPARWGPLQRQPP